MYGTFERGKNLPERKWERLQNSGIGRVWNVRPCMERLETENVRWNVYGTFERGENTHGLMWNVWKILGYDVYGTLERIWDVWESLG